MTVIFRVFVLVLASMPMVLCFGTGPPTGACHNMAPEHGGADIIEGKKDGNPYKFDVPNKVRAGETVTFKISGTKSFQGFLVRVIDTEEANGAGNFEDPNDEEPYKVMTCNKRADSASHFSPNKKGSVKLKWTAPSTPGKYRALATVLEKYDRAYVRDFVDITVVSASSSSLGNSLSDQPVVRQYFDQPAGGQSPVTTRFRQRPASSHGIENSLGQHSSTGGGHNVAFRSQLPLSAHGIGNSHGGQTPTLPQGFDQSFNGHIPSSSLSLHQAGRPLQIHRQVPSHNSHQFVNQGGLSQGRPLPIQASFPQQGPIAAPGHPGQFFQAGNSVGINDFRGRPVRSHHIPVQSQAFPSRFHQQQFSPAGGQASFRPIRTQQHQLAASRSQPQFNPFRGHQQQQFVVDRSQVAHRPFRSQSHFRQF